MGPREQLLAKLEALYAECDNAAVQTILAATIGAMYVCKERELGLAVAAWSGAELDRMNAPNN